MITEIEKTRIKHNNTSTAVKEVLGMTDEQYKDMQFECYLRFTDVMFDGYPAIRQQVAYSPLFRGFWLNEWEYRNEVEFLPFAYDCQFGHADLYSEYIYLHDYRRLMNDELFLLKYNQILALICKAK